MQRSLSEGIQPATPRDYARLLTIWETSIRATHHFVAEADIQEFRTLVREQALPAVALFCVRDANGEAVGFVGVAEGRVEMLFVDPVWQGKSVGRRLLTYAVEKLGAYALDVNEQNEGAVGFYEKQGFRVVGRSAVDGQGKPYPLLHMVIERP